MNKLIKIISPEGDFPVKKAVIALGVFDGVHAGHRLVVRSAVELAREADCCAGAVTFIPHPRQVLFPDSPFELLISERERICRLLDAGADFAAGINFDANVAQWSAETFLKNLRDCGVFEVAGICVGSKWRFGKDGSGSCGVLEKFCAENCIRFTAVPEAEESGRFISSSRIREAVAGGDLSKAQQLAGYFPRLTGIVRGGMKIAGKVLSAPTANLAVNYGIIPPDGVYAGFSGISGRIFPAVLNIGKAPTYNVDERRVEVHLVGFDGDLYGSELSVSLIKKLRDIRKFADPLELKNQICADIKAAVNCVETSEI